MPRALLAILHLPERLAHKSRRKRLEARLSRARAPRSILFVCHGNLYRSPYAAAALTHMLRFRQSPLRVMSAGFRGPDRPTPPEAVTEARTRDVDLSDHRSQLVTHALIDDASWIFVMNASQRDAIATLRGNAVRRVFVLGDLDPERIETREIVDPQGSGVKTLKRCYDRIDRCLEEVARLAFRG